MSEPDGLRCEALSLERRRCGNLARFEAEFGYRRRVCHRHRRARQFVERKPPTLDQLKVARDGQLAPVLDPEDTARAIATVSTAR